MFVIMFFIVAVAAFNIVSTLVMVVTDKQADIAILRTLGASPGSIMKIFIVQGTVIGVIGTLIGVGGGVLLAANIDVVVPFIERLFWHAFPGEGCVLHQRAAIGCAYIGCGGDSNGVVSVVPAGDAVSVMARVEDQPGGGAAL